jgi:hypothetical protein
MQSNFKSGNRVERYLFIHSPEMQKICICEQRHKLYKRGGQLSNKTRFPEIHQAAGIRALAGGGREGENAPAKASNPGLKGDWDLPAFFR